jgi:hypothetical protein
MELHLTPETEAKLNDLARRTRRGADKLVVEAVDHLVDYNDWFESRWRKASRQSLAARSFPMKKCASGFRTASAGKPCGASSHRAPSRIGRSSRTGNCKPDSRRRLKMRFKACAPCPTAAATAGWWTQISLFPDRQNQQAQSGRQQVIGRRLRCTPRGHQFHIGVVQTDVLKSSRSQ